MRVIRTTSRFDRDLRLAMRRGRDMAKFKHVRGRLLRGESLEPKHRDHPLRGDWVGCRECHIEADWLLVYAIESPSKPGGAETLVLIRVGTHADLFE